MRFLVDESLSRRVADLLRRSDHDAIHIGDLGLLRAPDDEVMTAARSDDRVLITVDTDFGGLLAFSHEAAPSAILIRRAPHAPESQVQLLLVALPEIRDHLTAGAVVVISPGQARVRPLPIKPVEE